MAFLNPLSARQLADDWQLWVLTDALIWREIDDRAVIVGADFVTDGASVPRFIWAIYPPFGPWSRAGVLHDYLCCLVAAGVPHPIAPTRADADGVFRRALASLNLRRRDVLLLWFGAKLGTWFGVRASMIDHNDKLRGMTTLAAAGPF